MCFITFDLSLCFQPLSDVSIPGHTVFYLPYFFGFSHRFRGPLGTPCLTRFPLKFWMHLFHINLNILYSRRPESIVIQSQNEVKVRENENLSSCPTLCDPMDFIVHRILLSRILEWVAIPFSRGSSQPRNRTGISCIADRIFTS